MNADRAEAYGRVVKRLEDVGPAKLHPAESERVRVAADRLLFAGHADEEASPSEALADVEELAEHLAESGRWAEESARRLLEEVAACGPPRVRSG